MQGFGKHPPSCPEDGAGLQRSDARSSSLKFSSHQFVHQLPVGAARDFGHQRFHHLSHVPGRMGARFGDGLSDKLLQGFRGESLGQKSLEDTDLNLFRSG